MTTHQVVSHDAWVAARKAFLEQEKQFTQARDALSGARRALPWEKVEKPYHFTGPNGEATLSDLFAGKSQLVIYHFMLGPDWAEGCKSCSFWADNFDGLAVHLQHRDVSFLAVSRAPLSKLLAYQKRMGWSFPWVSSYGSDFNFDFQASFTKEQLDSGMAFHNYHVHPNTMSELAGVSVFFKDEAGNIFHTYSAYARGLDILNSAYNILDLVPKGRNEKGLKSTMEWLRRHDQYED